MKVHSPLGNMHDAWYLNLEGTVHALHLQLNQEENALGNVGHISSTDLLHWERHTDVLPPLRGENTEDYHEKFTGCMVAHQDNFSGKQKIFCFYTMRDEKAASQRIGLAISEDGESFTTYSDNPVIIPDPELFVSYGNIADYDWDIVDCRDPIVVYRQEEDLYYLYFVAAAMRQDGRIGGAIAMVTSKDLIHWGKQTIVYSPRQNGMIEVPDVFQLDGKWYLTLLTGVNYRGRGGISDDGLSNFTVYASSDSPHGPFEEDRVNNILIGGNFQSGYTCRSVELDGVRYLLYIDRSFGGNTLSLPKELRVENGQLVALYSSKLKDLRDACLLSEEEQLPQPKLLYTSFAWHTIGGKIYPNGKSYFAVTDELDYQAALLPVKAVFMEMETELTLSAEGAGFAVLVTKEQGECCYLVSIEPGQVQLLEHVSFARLEGRKAEIKEGEKYHCRALFFEGIFELYLNGRLLLQCGFDTGKELQAGLYCDRGTARFDNLRIYSLINDRKDEVL